MRQSFDIDHIARLQFVMRHGDAFGRRPLDPRPSKFGRRDDAGAAVAENDLTVAILGKAGQGRQMPSGNARPVFDGSKPCDEIRVPVELDDRAAPAVTAVISDQTGAQIAHGNVLQPGVERGADLQAAFIQRRIAVLVIDAAADFFDEVIDIRHLGAERTLKGDKVFRLGGGGIAIGDVAVFRHLADDDVAPGDGGGFVANGIIVGGTFGQCRQIGRFRNGQFVQRFSEIVRGGGRDPIGILAEEYLVQIQLENMVFGEGLFDPHGEDRLADLAHIVDFVIQEKAFHHLLGDGGRALRPAVAVAQVADG